MRNIMIKKGLVYGIIVLLIVIVVLPAAGTVVNKNTKLEEQNIVDEQEIPLTTGDDVEIYIYAGHQTDDPIGPSYGFVMTIEVINHLSEAIWVRFQEDYFSLLSGQPIDAFQWKYQFVAPPNESTSIHSSGGVPIPCWYRVTAQAHVIEYVSRSGFQFRRFIFFPGEK